MTKSLELIVAFQGGGWYTEYGQRIAVFKGKDALLFIDFDRQIWGQVELDPYLDLETKQGQRGVARSVFQAYLRGNYSHIKDRDEQMMMGDLRVNDYQYIAMDQQRELLCGL